MKETSSNRLNKNEIISSVKEASLTCYGVNSIFTDSKKGFEEDAIYVSFSKDGTFELEVHVIVMSGVKVTETIRSLQKTIRYFMNRLYPKHCKKINIFAEGISSVN